MKKVRTFFFLPTAYLVRLRRPIKEAPREIFHSLMFKHSMTPHLSTQSQTKNFRCSILIVLTHLFHSIQTLNLFQLVTEIHSSALKSTCNLLILFSPSLLSLGREDGTVLSWDLNAGKEVYRFNADACGVKKVQYLRTGQLLTLSSSNGGLNTPQLKIWDLRAKDQCIFALGRQSKGADKENVDTKRKARYTCVRSHPIDEKILTGTSTGKMERQRLIPICSLYFESCGN